MHCAGAGGRADTLNCSARQGQAVARLKKLHSVAILCNQPACLGKPLLGWGQPLLQCLSADASAVACRHHDRVHTCSSLFRFLHQARSAGRSSRGFRTAMNSSFTTLNNNHRQSRFRVIRSNPSRSVKLDPELQLHAGLLKVPVPLPAPGPAVLAGAEAFDARGAPVAGHRGALVAQPK